MTRNSRPWAEGPGSVQGCRWQFPPMGGDSHTTERNGPPKPTHGWKLLARRRNQPRKTRPLAEIASPRRKPRPQVEIAIAADLAGTQNPPTGGNCRPAGGTSPAIPTHGWKLLGPM